MTLRASLLAAATMLALPLAAQAQPVNGLYIAGGAGVNWRSNTDDQATLVSGGVAFPFTSFDVRPDAGWAAVASIGWGFGNGLRLEVEGNYRRNGVRRLNLGNTYSGAPMPPYLMATSDVSGTITTYGVMVNAFYEFNLGWIQPYVGAGIGYGWNDFDNVGATFFMSSYRVTYGGNSGQFAYQGIAGVAVPIAAVPGLALTAEYRYYATSSPGFTGRITIPLANNAPLATAGTIKPENQNQSLMIGVRYNFGRAPAAPPPAAAPAPASSFIVFFDFNRDDLTARAREIVAQAAAAARSQQVTRIEVAGHTDTVGSAQYNQGLSQRRANSVAAELVRLGVPRQAIQTAGYGFSRPLVPTGPNVREPQNRRVEIVFR